MKKNQQGSPIRKIVKVCADALSASHLVFLCLAIPVILLFAFNTPPGWGLDEQVHAARAYQIAEGGLYPDSLTSKGAYGGALPTSLVNTLNYGHTVSNAVNRGDITFQRKDLVDPGVTKSLLEQPINDSSKTIYDFGPTGPYAPFVYAGSATGFFIGIHTNSSVGSAVFMAKAVQALIYVGIVFIALYVLRQYRARWLIFVVALLPSSLYQAASINADSITIAASLLFFAICLRAFIQKTPLSKKLLLLLAASVIGLALSKPSYVFLSLILLLLPASSFGSSHLRIAFKYGLFALNVILMAIFTLKGMQYSDSILMYREASVAANISLSGQLLWVSTHPLQFVEVFIQAIILNTREWQASLIGVLGYNTVPVYYPIQAILLSLMMIVSMTAERVKGSVLAAFAGAGLLSAAAVIGVLYATFNEVGSNSILGVQGRYFIPCLVFVLLAIPSVLPFDISKIRPRLLTLGVTLVCTFSLLATALTYMKFLY